MEQRSADGAVRPSEEPETQVMRPIASSPMEPPAGERAPASQGRGIVLLSLFDGVGTARIGLDM
eukprot:11004327-Alexandrium_andersonii.AAC.1